MPEEAADNATQTPNTPSDPTALHCPQCDDSRKRPWYVLDVILLGSLFVLGAFGHASAVFFYFGGLRNDMMLPFYVAMIRLLLVLPTAACLLAILICVVWRWPRHIDHRVKLLVLLIVTIAVSVVWAGYLFLRLGPPGYMAYTWGLRTYARKHVDVAGVRVWRSSLDPNACEGVLIRIRIDDNGNPKPVLRSTGEDAELPECILCLEPRYIRLSLDAQQRPIVRLTWGSGFLGTWGVSVGHEQMEVPKTQPRTKEVLFNGQVFLNAGEYRLPLAPGAYVWHALE